MSLFALKLPSIAETDSKLTESLGFAPRIGAKKVSVVAVEQAGNAVDEPETTIEAKSIEFDEELRTPSKTEPKNTRRTPAE